MEILIVLIILDLILKNKLLVLLDYHDKLEHGYLNNTEISESYIEHRKNKCGQIMRSDSTMKSIPPINILMIIIVLIKLVILQYKYKLKFSISKRKEEYIKEFNNK